MPQNETPLVFLATSLDDLKEFPELALKDAGYQLGLVQVGKEPTDWKPFTSVASGVREIRIKKEGAFRVMYITKLNETVYVLHAFEKKTQKTRQSDIDLAKTRYKDLLKDLGDKTK